MNNCSEIFKIVAALAEYYDKQLTANQMSMYVHDLLELQPDELLKAIYEYRNIADNHFFPLPAKLKSLAKPKPSEEQNAVDAVSRIIEAISKFGPYRYEEARKFVGEIGWMVIQRDGGWNAVCQFLTEDNMGQFRAQWREMAKAFSARSKAGLTDVPPDLPRPISIPSGSFAKLGEVLSKALQPTQV